MPLYKHFKVTHVLDLCFCSIFISNQSTDGAKSSGYKPGSLASTRKYKVGTLSSLMG